MRRYTTKDEDDLIRQIESDPELDKGWEQVVQDEPDIRDFDPFISVVMTFLQDGPKTDAEILSIPGVTAHDLAKARTLGLIEHLGHTVWLTSAGKRLVAYLKDIEDREDSQELNAEVRKEIAEARAEIKAGRVHTSEEVKRELGL